MYLTWKKSMAQRTCIQFGSIMFNHVCFLKNVVVSTIAGRVPNRFGTELSEPKVSECQEPKFFINRIITTVNFPNTTEPKRKTNRSALFRCDVFSDCPKS